MPSQMLNAPQARELLALSARIGADSALVQGPGGNTSVKHDGTMWVKASGTELADALRRDIFVPVDLKALLLALEQDDPACETSLAFVPQHLNPQGLRPSIETTMHALLPQPIVAHVHCVATIAWAIRKDVEAALAEKLAGLNWIFVPYTRPGLPLTLAIRARLKPGTNVIVLGNHGLVAAGETVREAASLLAEVGRRLQSKLAPGAEPDIDVLFALCAGAGYAPAADSVAHALALDPARLRHAAGGSLYPDHVIFLGPSVTALCPGETLPQALARSPQTPQPLVLAPGIGALLPRDASNSAHAMARCLGDVLARIPPGVELNTLSPEDEAALLNWDAEKYRQAFNRARFS